jgi:hypothetical protein
MKKYTVIYVDDELGNLGAFRSVIDWFHTRLLVGIWSQSITINTFLSFIKCKDSHERINIISLEFPIAHSKTSGE